MNFVNLIGATLDDKYKIERELGRGGMGTVYLATHIGTERPVAVKIIAPQFMERAEFVERFRREARAAGRLRHPNVVNVTDFGFAETKDGKVAYLAMEYLDGCTLGEILEEEQKLPLAWTLDIIEQVCSAVHEAHQQGIIHRDLKPDNIWLEPNQRGNYTVKVLDFGIAKLEEEILESAENAAAAENTSGEHFIAAPRNSAARSTIADAPRNETSTDFRHLTEFGESKTMAQIVESKTILSEAGTLVQTLEPLSGDEAENKTAVFADNATLIADQKEAGTKIISAQIQTDNLPKKFAAETSPSLLTTKELTRVGAVLGTPLYMSPEQCRGERLTHHSDIYSLGVIAYQMLSGKTPFSGDYLKVMEAHKNLAAPPLEVKKVRKKVKDVINSALSKSIADRPPTAQAFASEMRAQSEGIGALLRRSLTIYSEHLPKFLGLTLLIFLPSIIVTFVKLLIDGFYAAGYISGIGISALNAIMVFPVTFTSIFCGQLITGTTTWLVIQFLAVPLRPLNVKMALAATKKSWKRLIGTGLLSTGLTFLGLLFCGLGFPVLSVLFVLVAPVVMMENLRGFAALKRSTNLVLRSLKTTVASVFIMFIVPMLFGAAVSLFVLASAKSVTDLRDKVMAARGEIQQSSEESVTSVQINNGAIKIETGSAKSATDDAKTGSQIFREVFRDGLTNLLMMPIQILLMPLCSIVIALLYLKTRQVGGESMQDLLAQFEEADQPRTNWQKRVHERLEQSGKLTGGKSFLNRKSGTAAEN